jgi:hypothetical protein
MLFFRSEERVNELCRTKGVPRRPIVTLVQLWQLSVEWYSNRMSPDARRPKPDETRRIFARIGLEGPFWDQESDDFG